MKTLCQEEVCIEMRTLALIVFFQFLTLFISARDNRAKYWITFTDKDNTPYSVENPEDFLSEKAIERRDRQSIEIIEEDLPVDPVYIQNLNDLGLSVINISKWFNGVLVATDDSVLMDTIHHLDFIQGPAVFVKPALSDSIESVASKKLRTVFDPVLPDYGYSANQVEMLNGDYLHQQGFTGEDMTIAILDAGFQNTNEISSLQHIWNDDRIIGIHDFVQDGTNILENHNHGTIVFSVIGGIEDQLLYGTAPHADFALIRTEDGPSEFLIEEYNWICGAEFADSIGADVFNTSLGYSLFDDTTQNHTYADMDGETTPITIAANIAASKGIVLVGSAGNAGASTWYRITAPADAVDYLTIGAVDADGFITDFSSRGPSYDGRVKPDVVAQGLYTTSQLPDGEFAGVSGTSLSSPVVCGLVACLWQSNPEANYKQVLDAVRQSSSQYLTPDQDYGYGIPDFLKANLILKNNLQHEFDKSLEISVFPNPVSDNLFLEVYLRTVGIEPENIRIRFTDLTGRIIKIEDRSVINRYSIMEFDDIGYLPNGVYMIQIIVSGTAYSASFVKID
ncbi:MAG: S8 family peptidase [Bacteroidales bacterium]|nr:S8 family peptidase [Bacteroidales bacterium]